MPIWRNTGANGATIPFKIPNQYFPLPIVSFPLCIMLVFGTHIDCSKSLSDLSANILLQKKIKRTNRKWKEKRHYLARGSGKISLRFKILILLYSIVFPVCEKALQEEGPTMHGHSHGSSTQYYKTLLSFVFVIFSVFTMEQIKLCQRQTAGFSSYIDETRGLFLNSFYIGQKVLLNYKVFSLHT